MSDQRTSEQEVCEGCGKVPDGRCPDPECPYHAGDARTSNPVAELFHGCVSLMDGNKLTLHFETTEEAEAAADYILKLGVIPDETAAISCQQAETEGRAFAETTRESNGS